ncbi:energy transducer TonB [Mucilaginibacter sp. 44-25]|uniref:energy transducer TonB n=1 Tax=Mucilaginibacter sp. 44-25 TaxID=1895794 RepID=UPI00095DDDEE|nr:energy transducer TonB [Mucilaginibacter sp. 44-25]OJW18317.1 MAG: hypothetical protein BGO48_17355 [Mucilaginibacter sp. 44-25]
MKPYVFALFLLINITGFAQEKQPEAKTRPDTVRHYMVNDSTLAYSESAAKFLRLMIKADSGMFRVKDYYLNGSLRMVTLTSLDNMNIRPGINGMYDEYYENGKRKTSKVFNKGKITGDVLSYYSNGALRCVETYSADGVYLKQFLDSTGNQLTVNGNGKWIKYTHSPGERLEGNVINGKEEGEWNWYLGDKIYTTLYKKGKILYAKRDVPNGDPIFIHVDKNPSFPGGLGALRGFIIKNIEYPVKARLNNIQGTVIITFIIETDGSLSDIRVVKGMGAGCDEEAMRVITLSPKWVPGESLGKQVRVQRSIPISFRLGS